MTKTRLIPAISFCVVLIALIASCVKDVGKLPVAAPVSACDTITYTKHIKPIIEDKCKSCHGATPSPGAFPLTTYDEVKPYGTSGQIRNSVINESPLMPLGGPALTQDKKDLISCWLNNGMKQ